MPRFVILRHETPPGYERPTHWDLMLESGRVLRTWALEELPKPGQSVSAEQLPEHRLAYLDYEGEVVGNRGRVTRVEYGKYDLVDEANGQIRAQLDGQTLRGQLLIMREDAGGHRWRVSLVAG
jgi:hypothetical protein